MDDPKELPKLTPEEQEIYSWQMDISGFGELAQQKLKASTVFISRVGGVGGLVAQQLAAAGVGRLILATAGSLRPSDLNRQLLQSHAKIGQPRIDTLIGKLHSLNPRLEIIGHAENVSDANALQLISNADVIVDAAPLFEERFAINRAAVRLGKPMVECAMYALEATITTFIPGLTGCLACLYPVPPPTWTRRFPVLGAVSGTVACLGAVEVVKLLTSLGTTLSGTLLKMDLGSMHFRRLRIYPDPNCPICKAC